MGDRNFRQMLEARWNSGCLVCVGLDSEFSKIPDAAHRSGNEDPVSVANTTVAFNRAIVEATKDLVCAYKPNTAFYEAHGDFNALRRTVADIHTIAPDVPVILDAKRADIGNTNNGYVEMAFDFLRVDAITVHPYLGAEALAPFLARKEKGIIVLCRTSNSGAGEFQDLPVPNPIAGADISVVGEDPGPVLAPATIPLYQFVARRVANEWNKNGNCAVVVGATYPKELREVRGIVGDMPILVPGIGAQGGDLEATIEAGCCGRGWWGQIGMIINSSRGIIFASKGADYADAARREAVKLNDGIKAALAKAA